MSSIQIQSLAFPIHTLSADSPMSTGKAAVLFTVAEALPECLGPASSIEWFMLLDGSLTVEARRPTPSPGGKKVT